MNANPSQRLAIGISARALFDLQAAEKVLLEHGRDAHRRHQLEQAEEPLPGGPGLSVLRALLHGDRPDRGVEVVVLSEGVADLSLRVLSAARKESLEVDRAAFTGGEPLAPYLRAFRVDLFLAADKAEAARAMEAGTAAAIVRAAPEETEGAPCVRISIDGAAVAAASAPAKPDAPAEVAQPPVPRWVSALVGLQRLGSSGKNQIQTALLCSDEPAVQERVLRALGEWGVDLDQAFFSSSDTKAEVLEAYRPHLVFDVVPALEQAEEALGEESDGKIAEQRSRFRRRA